MTAVVEVLRDVLHDHINADVAKLQKKSVDGSRRASLVSNGTCASALSSSTEVCIFQEFANTFVDRCVGHLNDNLVLWGIDPSAPESEDFALAISTSDKASSASHHRAQAAQQAELKKQQVALQQILAKNKAEVAALQDTIRMKRLAKQQSLCEQHDKTFYQNCSRKCGEAIDVETAQTATLAAEAAAADMMKVQLATLSRCTERAEDHIDAINKRRNHIELIETQQRRQTPQIEALLAGGMEQPPSGDAETEEARSLEEKCQMQLKRQQHWIDDAC